MTTSHAAKRTLKYKGLNKRLSLARMKDNINPDETSKTKIN